MNTWWLVIWYFATHKNLLSWTLTKPEVNSVHFSPILVTCQFPPTYQLPPIFLVVWWNVPDTALPRPDQGSFSTVSSQFGEAVPLLRGSSGLSSASPSFQRNLISTICPCELVIFITTDSFYSTTTIQYGDCNNAVCKCHPLFFHLSWIKFKDT